MIVRLFLALFFAALTASAQAATYNFCDCGTGSDPACLPGADTNSGATTLAGATGPMQTWAKFLLTWSQKGPGDILQMCKGGAWNGAAWGTTRSVNGTVDQYIANPLVVQSFSPTQFSSSAKPIWNINGAGCTYNDPSGACVGFQLYQGAASGGFVFRGIRMLGQDVAAQGGVMIVSGNVRNVLFDDMTLEHLDGGFTCSNQAGGTSPRNITLRNSALSYILGMGASSWGCFNTVIENSSFDHTANGSVANKYLYHAIYFSGNENDPTNPTGDTTGGVIRHNSFTNTALNSTGDPTHCAGVIIVGHGKIGGMIVENNYLYQAAGTSGGGCYGISISPGNNNGSYEYEKQYRARGNTIINAGNIGILTSACIDCTIENNVIVKTESWDDFTGVQLSNMSFPIITQSERVKVRNNSIFIKQATGDSVGIRMGGWASAGGHEVASNLIMFGSGGPGSSGACFALDTPTSNVGTWNNNLCYNFARWAKVSNVSFRGCINNAAGTCPGSPSAGTILTVTAAPTLPLQVGWELSTAGGITAGTTIVNQLTGTTGGMGTYTVSTSQAVTEGNKLIAVPAEVSYATKANFTSAFGFDANSLTTDPQLFTDADPSLANGWTMKLKSTSPARNAGHSTKSSPLALGGYPKVGPRDIGAYEYGSNP